jgi:hypothetical protein
MRYQSGIVSLRLRSLGIALRLGKVRVSLLRRQNGKCRFALSGNAALPTVGRYQKP